MKQLHTVRQKGVNIYIQGGLRRGGLTPALAPRMPAITEDAVQATRGRKCDRTAKGYTKNNSCLNEEKENTGNRLETATNFAIRHTMTNSSSRQQ